MGWDDAIINIGQSGVLKRKCSMAMDVGCHIFIQDSRLVSFEINANGLEKLSQPSIPRHVGPPGGLCENAHESSKNPSFCLDAVT